MATKTAKKKGLSSAEKMDRTASILTTKFLEQVSNPDGSLKSVADLGGWSKPWIMRGEKRPHNVASGTAYKGANSFLLGLVAMDHDAAIFSTFKGWQGLGLRVIKGESGTPLIKWNVNYVCVEGCKGWHHKREDVKCGHSSKKVISANSFTVFGYWQVTADSETNAAAIPGVDFPYHKDFQPSDLNPTDIDLSSADKVKNHFLKTGVNMTDTDDQAYYFPARDIVNVAPANQFVSIESYASTMAHELCHWTMGPDRIVRKLSYAAEELVAELGACVLVSDMNIDHTPMMAEGDNHTAYLRGWLEPLIKEARTSEGSRVIWDACDKAAKAAAFVADLTGPFIK